MEEGAEVAASIGDVLSGDCPGRGILEHITSRWGLLVLVALREGPLRFHQLRDRIGGISEKMLAQTLRVLVRDGLLERTVEPATPPKVFYALTPLGQDGIPALCEVIRWISRATPGIQMAQRRYDAGLTEG
ncbi:DNA-binding HxlR family transcriptional regulator [Thermocatellispora tengchongensis]|uniref:DNA-binding HxlR family transcriptional regulator n=1 Tax=Thermocatellispora tengchongensis TaxID=1073253 RepID=A0A840P5Y1_9ACTN|nr:helix-turn-helix domain-containing protein [Thermocatellispora tengchongensis]MBB5133313.1 DNA-binding HxlR family transcriptional regulator [Thermocatellispora tengchongensis]